MKKIAYAAALTTLAISQPAFSASLVSLHTFAPAPDVSSPIAIGLYIALFGIITFRVLKGLKDRK